VCVAAGEALTAAYSSAGGTAQRYREVVQGGEGGGGGDSTRDGVASRWGVKMTLPQYISKSVWPCKPAAAAFLHQTT
jgi:hypothetical protein